MGDEIRLTISDDLRFAAAAFHKRRVLAGTNLPFTCTLGETAFMSHYSRTITVDDLVRQGEHLTLLPTDDLGQKVRVIHVKQWPGRVWARQLDADVYVLIEASEQEVVINGWLSLEQLEEAPIEWLLTEGKRTNYTYHVDKPFLWNLPSAFAFKSCPHLAAYGGIWDERRQGWECCGCGTYVHDADSRDNFPARYETFEQHRRERNQNLAKEAEAKRPET